ncbi:S-locus glycoprotein domain containing protein [Parasponia andersonii]|uniref:S-locus glycoprotein domain containing protein n=1 Tax=Parasponia andersonii TaxID=3476 RepID=A0A2P5BW59_PARAD|nr:S-locus glycoprotein domain containing protein [Parasponia andersonii]
MSSQNQLFEREPWHFFDLGHGMVNDDEFSYTYNLENNSVISRILINEMTSTWDRSIWIETERRWLSYFSVPSDHYDKYGRWGANGNCIISDGPICQCLKGFRPKSPEQWSSMDWSQGRVRKNPLGC